MSKHLTQRCDLRSATSMIATEWVLRVQQDTWLPVLWYTKETAVLFITENMLRWIRSSKLC